MHPRSQPRIAACKMEHLRPRDQPNLQWQEMKGCLQTSCKCSLRTRHQQHACVLQRTPSSMNKVDPLLWTAQGRLPHTDVCTCWYPMCASGCLVQGIQAHKWASPHTPAYHRGFRTHEVPRSLSQIPIAIRACIAHHMNTFRRPNNHNPLRCACHHCGLAHHTVGNTWVQARKPERSTHNSSYMLCGLHRGCHKSCLPPVDNECCMGKGPCHCQFSPQTPPSPCRLLAQGESIPAARP
mmetsp:Transcript_807/g.1965  ORF Transcript_807/g.1965 Transcript_807/m.1965 type:complete len:238 (-) Transcript_807:929-1642(-)